MTWRKTGSEFDDECAHIGLTNGAYRTHMEAIGHIYTLELMSCRFPKRSLRRFASSPTVNDDIKELVEIGYWREFDTDYVVLHHGDVIRQSLAAQGLKRDRDKKAQARLRERKSQPGDDTSGTPQVSADVSAYVSVDTDRQTDKHLEEGGSRTCTHGVRTEFWSCHQCERKETA